MFGAISEKFRTFDMQIDFAIPQFFTFVGGWGNSFPFFNQFVRKVKNLLSISGQSLIYLYISAYGSLYEHNRSRLANFLKSTTFIHYGLEKFSGIKADLWQFEAVVLTNKDLFDSRITAAEHIYAFCCIRIHLHFRTNYYTQSRYPLAQIHLLAIEID